MKNYYMYRNKVMSEKDALVKNMNIYWLDKILNQNSEHYDQVGIDMQWI